jgi:hypothetical protein
VSLVGEISAVIGWFLSLQSADVDHYLLITSTVFIILTLIAYIAKEFLSPLIRSIRLRHPIKARFVITSADRYNIGYAPQDEFEHEVKTLVLPSFTHNLFVHLLWTVKLSFKQYHLEISLGGERTKKPIINHYFHPFFKMGDATRIPGEYPGHYIDYHDNYHVDVVRDYAKGQFVTAGFKVTTRDPGTYTLKIGIAADGVDGTAELDILVEDIPKTLMKCKKHANCRLQPKLIKKF